MAGGWAIISLDDLPINVTAGEQVKIGFMVLQHGQTPMTGLEPTVTARLSLTEKFVVNATPEGKPGHYTATLTFPKEGNWEWSIQAFSMDQKMPTLSVAAASVIESKGQSVVKGEAVNESTSLLLIVRVLVFGIGLLGLVIAFQRRSRLVGGLAGVCLLVGFVMVVTAPAVPRVEAQAGLSSEESSASSIPQVEIGRQLFIAKGCITCHINEKATNDGSMTLLMEAPNLSKFSANPEMLRMRLEDPASVKSDTWMPDLDLSSAEIKALIAFVNSK